jgi:hypothetical protein
LRFTVHRPGIPAASPRSHGVPRRDVPGRVHVSVAGVSAGGAPESGLALARLPIHPPARRAPLARERRIDLLYPTRSLVLQPTDQQAPPRVQDGPVEPSLGSYISTRIIDCAHGRSRHVPYRQIFDLDYVEPPCDIGTGFLDPVLAPIRLTSVQPTDGDLYPTATSRATSSPGQLMLQPLQLPAFPNPPCLPPRRPPSRVTRIEEGAHRLGKVPQRLLLHHLGPYGKPRIIGTGSGELSALLRVPGRASSTRPPVLVLLDSQIPNVPGVTTVVSQHTLLGRGGKQSVSTHANTLSITADISGEVKRHAPFSQKAQVPTSRAR